MLFGTSVKINNNTTKVSGFLGWKFASTVTNIVGAKKVKSLFYNIGTTGFSFHSFFTLEIIMLLERITNGSSVFGLSKGNLLEIVEELKSDNRLDNAIELNRKYITDRLVYTPTKEQETVFNKYEYLNTLAHYRGMLISMDTGTGKTYTAVAIAEAVDSEYIFVITKKKIIDLMWNPALTKELYKKAPTQYYAGTGSYKNERYILVNLERLEEAVAIAKQLPKGNITIIVDEIHYVTNSTTSWSVSLLSLIAESESRNVLLLSGTPIKSYTKEVGVINSYLDTRYDSKTESIFKALYASPNSFMRETMQVRYGELSARVEKASLNLQEVKTYYVNVKLDNSNEYTLENIAKIAKAYSEDRLKELSSSYTLYENTYYRLYNRIKQEILSETPKMIREFDIYEKEFKEVIRLYNRRQLRNESKLLSSVNKFEKNILLPRLTGSEKEEFREAKTIVKYPALKVQGEVLGRIVSGYRIKCRTDLAKSIKYENYVESTDKKTVVFSNNIEVCEAAIRKLKSTGYKPASVYGGSGNASSAVNDFKKNKKTNPMVATYDSLGTGIPLIEANVLVIIDLPFRLYKYDQALARLWRKGQTEQVYVYILNLDTGDTPNIVSRNIDIIKYFKDEVAKITGYDVDISLDGINISNEELSYDYELSDIVYDKSVSNESFILGW